MIYSYDVFDTIITRACGHPLGVFAIIQKTLETENCDIPNSVCNNFRDIRVFCEQEARNETEEEDLTVVDIYNYIGAKYKLNKPQIDYLINLELSTELYLSEPLNENIIEIEELLSKNKKVIFLSDMYLRKKDIYTLLKKNAPTIVDKCDLIVSSEIKKTKHNGTLYSYVIDKYGIKPNELIHKGDNFYSDVTMAKKRGVKGLHYKKTSDAHTLMDRFLRFGGLYDYGYQYSLGASRLVTLETENKVQKIGALYAGPWLVGFLQWLNKTIKDHGFSGKKIHFLARDGEVLLELIKYYPGFEDFELNYLHLSRQSTVFASIREFDPFTVDYLFQGYPYINIEMIASRCFLDYETLKRFWGDSSKDWNVLKKLSQTEIDSFKSILLSSKELQDLIITKAKEQRELLLEYLEQEGFFDSKDSVIIDLGWQCTIQDALVKVVNKKCNVHGYYFGVTKYFDKEDTTNVKNPYYFDHLTPDSIVDRPYFIVFTELFSFSNEASTIGYKKLNSRIIPIKNSIKNKFPWIPDIREGAINYLVTLKKYYDINKIDFRTFAMYIMHQLLDPTYEDACTIGSFEYSADPFDSDLRELAPKLSIFKYITGRLHSNWKVASFKRSSKIYMYLFDLRIKYRNNKDKAKRGLKNPKLIINYIFRRMGLNGQ